MLRVHGPRQPQAQPHPQPQPQAEDSPALPSLKGPLAVIRDVHYLLDCFAYRCMLHGQECSLATMKALWKELDFSLVLLAVPRYSNPTDHIRLLYSAALDRLDHVSLCTQTPEGLPHATPQGLQEIVDQEGGFRRSEEVAKAESPSVKAGILYFLWIVYNTQPCSGTAPQCIYVPLELAEPLLCAVDELLRSAVRGALRVLVELQGRGAIMAGVVRVPARKAQVNLATLGVEASADKLFTILLEGRYHMSRVLRMVHVGPLERAQAEYDRQRKRLLGSLVAGGSDEQGEGSNSMHPASVLADGGLPGDLQQMVTQCSDDVRKALDATLPNERHRKASAAEQRRRRAQAARARVMQRARDGAVDSARLRLREQGAAAVEAEQAEVLGQFDPLLPITGGQDDSSEDDESDKAGILGEHRGAAAVLLNARMHKFAVKEVAWKWLQAQRQLHTDHETADPGMEGAARPEAVVTGSDGLQEAQDDEALGSENKSQTGRSSSRAPRAARGRGGRGRGSRGRGRAVSSAPAAGDGSARGRGVRGARAGTARRGRGRGRGQAAQEAEDAGREDQMAEELEAAMLEGSDGEGASQDEKEKMPAKDKGGTTVAPVAPVTTSRKRTRATSARPARPSKSRGRSKKAMEREVADLMTGIDNEHDLGGLDASAMSMANAIGMAEVLKEAERISSDDESQEEAADAMPDSGEAGPSKPSSRPSETQQAIADAERLLAMMDAAMEEDDEL